MDSVLQVLIYVTDREYLKTVNSVYGEYFNTLSNRAAVIVAGLARRRNAGRVRGLCAGVYNLNNQTVN